MASSAHSIQQKMPWRDIITISGDFVPELKEGQGVARNYIEDAPNSAGVLISRPTWAQVGRPREWDGCASILFVVIDPDADGPRRLRHPLGFWKLASTDQMVCLLKKPRGVGVHPSFKPHRCVLTQALTP